MFRSVGTKRGNICKISVFSCSHTNWRCITFEINIKLLLNYAANNGRQWGESRARNAPGIKPYFLLFFISLALVCCKRSGLCSPHLHNVFAGSKLSPFSIPCRPSQRTQYVEPKIYAYQASPWFVRSFCFIFMFIPTQSLARYDYCCRFGL